MDLRRHVRRTEQDQEKENDEKLYPHDLQLYDKPPTSVISLHDFEEIALDRLKALKAIETVTQRGFVKQSEEWRGNLLEELNKQGLKHLANLYSSPGNVGLKNTKEQRKRDHISHFILCLAYCRTEELRNWFTNRELELFQARFDSLTPEGLKLFLNIHHFDFKPIPEKEKQAQEGRLLDTFQYLRGPAFEKTDFYKVPFRRVCELVRSRRVLLHRGMCYIPSSDLGTVLASRLRQEIAHSLAVLRQDLADTAADKQLDWVLKCLLDAHEAGNYRPSASAVQDTLRPEDLDELSKRSFPPCMRRMHEALRSRHHLRHGARQQYSLFLKQAGLPLEDALRFWRAEFLKSMAPEKFEREHAYTIRYNYGKEGKRTNFSGYGCSKIMQTAPGPDDFHGCPFRHCKQQDLRRLLLSYKISTQALAEIMEPLENNLYTQACQKLFLAVHDKGVAFGLSHPNQFFAESRALITGVKQEKPAGGTPSSSSTYGSPASTPRPQPATPLPSQETPGSRAAQGATPVSRRALPVSSGPPKTPVVGPAKTPAAGRGAEKPAEREVSDWLDEADDDLLSQISAMDTTQ